MCGGRKLLEPEPAFVQCIRELQHGCAAAARRRPEQEVDSLGALGFFYTRTWVKQQFGKVFLFFGISSPCVDFPGQECVGIYRA